MFFGKKDKLGTVQKEESKNSLTVLQDNGLVSVRCASLKEIETMTLQLIQNKNTVRAISELFPAGIKTAAKLVDKVRNASVQIYTLPLGTSIVPSLDGTGFRGLIKNKENSRIIAHANFKKMDPQELKKVANLASNVLDVGSLVTGEMQMAEIKKELKNISKDVENINDFLETEFQSRMISILPQVQEINDFMDEILVNDVTRNRELAHLKGLLDTSSQLLQQANLRMKNRIKKTRVSNIKEYQNEIDKLKLMWEQQEILTKILKRISELRDVVSKGEMSAEKCYYIYNDYLYQTSELRESLKSWHEEQVYFLKINLKEKKRRKKGLIQYIDRVPLPEKVQIPDTWKVVEIDDSIHSDILYQMNKNKVFKVEKSILEEDIRIVEKQDEYFYVSG